MARNKGWQNFYIPENYEEPLEELKASLDLSGTSFSKVMQDCLVGLFKKHGISFTDKTK